MQDLEQVVADQNARFVVRDKGIVRDIEFCRFMAHPAQVFRSGIRRCVNQRYSPSFQSIILIGDT